MRGGGGGGYKHVSVSKWAFVQVQQHRHYATSGGSWQASKHAADIRHGRTFRCAANKSSAGSGKRHSSINSVPASVTSAGKSGDVSAAFVGAVLALAAAAAAAALVPGPWAAASA